MPNIGLPLSLLEQGQKSESVSVNQNYLTFGRQTFYTFYTGIHLTHSEIGINNPCCVFGDEANVTQNAVASLGE